MNLSKKQKFIVTLGTILTICGYSLVNYLNKQKVVYVLSQPETEEMTLDCIQNDDNKGVETIYVHVEGQVKNPGIYKLEKEDRVHNAIVAAGGFSEEADRRKINLAKKISDEEFIYVPMKGEELILQTNDSSFIESQISQQISSSENNLININRATEDELRNLPGIGEALAKRIVEYRREYGNFAGIEDLRKVNGIGTKKFNDLKDKITVK